MGTFPANPPEFPANPLPDYPAHMPEQWRIYKDDIAEAIATLAAGIEHTEAALLDHDATLGRAHPKNRLWAEKMERDLAKMRAHHDRLRRYSANTLPS